MFKIILCFIFFSFPSGLFFLNAQEDAQHFIGASFGGSDFHIKDNHVSTLIYSSIVIAPSLQYFYKGELSRQYGEMSYYSGHLSTSTDNFNDKDIRANLKYSYLLYITELKILNDPLKLFIGGSFGSFLSHSDYDYLYMQNTRARAYESWYWSTSIDLSAELDYTISSREFLTAQFFLPVISNVSRPTYSPAGDYNTDVNDWKFKLFGKTEFFMNNFSLSTSISYQRPVAGNFNLQLNYEFYYSFYNKPNDIGMYMNNFRAGVFFCF